MPAVFGYSSLILLLPSFSMFQRNNVIHSQSKTELCMYPSISFDVSGVTRAFLDYKFKLLVPDNRWEATTAAHDLHDAPQWLCFMDVCVYVFVYAVCHGPTVHVVTGRIPGTMFVYTEPLTHPNNQPLWAFLIPTQSQWSQVELATGEIRYSNTASWSTSRGLSFPHPLSPLCFLYCNSQRDTDLKLTGCIQKAGPLGFWGSTVSPPST